MNPSLDATSKPMLRAPTPYENAMFVRALITACLLTLAAPVLTAAVGFAPEARAAERTKEELKALKKVMKQWSKALGVKCKNCHNTKDFKEWTAQREIGMAMSEVFTKKLKSPTGEPIECSSCHTKSVKPDEAKLKAFPAKDLKALAADFEAKSAGAKTDEAKKKLAEVAAYLNTL